MLLCLEGKGHVHPRVPSLVHQSYRPPDFGRPPGFGRAPPELAPTSTLRTAVLVAVAVRFLIDCAAVLSTRRVDAVALARIMTNFREAVVGWTPLLQYACISAREMLPSWSLSMALTKSLASIGSPVSESSFIKLGLRRRAI